MSQIMPNGGSDPEVIDLRWKDLYKVGGIAALLCALMYLVALGVYVPANLAGPPPEAVPEWFAVFEDSPITGLFFLGLADIVIMILWGPMTLALYAILERSNRTWALIATVFVFVGIGVFLATNVAFSMLSLSDAYAATTEIVEEYTLLAAGQAMLAVSRGTGGQYLGMPLVWLSGLILSTVMLQNKAFPKTAAWVGILGLGLLVLSIPFAHYTVFGEASPVRDAIIAVTYVGGGLLSLAWYILVGLRLLKIARA
jgi:hypothetical protein